MERKCAALITDQDFEKIALSLREPNIFRALSIERKELRHSNFIAFILDPRENHGLKDIVLRKLLRDIFSESKAGNRTIFDADSVDLSNIEIRREWRNIDILIILDDDIILIENKVDTLDHINQLKRYQKIAEESFPKKFRHYVYLTPTGSDPRDADAQGVYITYSYVQICEIIESILELYSNSISQKIGYYLSDYLITVKRELLMNDKLNDLAVKVYNAHREAFDFIFANRPDPSSILYPYFEKEIVNGGFVMGSKGKGVARFTTERLATLLPKSGQGWPGKEVFLFEIDYYWTDKTAGVIAVIAPCDDDTRERLHNAVKKSKFYKLPGGKKWLVVYRTKFLFVASEMIKEDEAEIRGKIRKIIEDVKPALLDIAETIAKHFVKKQ